MAVFDAQLSTLCTAEMKARVNDLAKIDAPRSVADVVRVAVEMALGALEEMSPAERQQAYAKSRVGLPIDVAIALAEPALP